MRPAMTPRPHALSMRAVFAAVFLGAIALCTHAAADDVLLKDLLAGAHEDDDLLISKRQLLQVPLDYLAVIRRPDGQLGLTEVEPQLKRPMKIVFNDNLSRTVPLVTRDYILETLLPAAASLLGRFIRVRYPLGPLNFGDTRDVFTGMDIPPGPLVNGSYDADIVITATSRHPDSPQCRGVVQSLGGIDTLSQPVIYAQITRRPIYSQLLLCDINPAANITDNLQTVMYELFQAVGFFHGALGSFFGKRTGRFDVIKYIDAPPSDLGGPPPPQMSLITPNALREARKHFDCATMDSVLMDRGIFASHLSLRLFDGDILSPRNASALPGLHYNRVAVTDVALALMQDTGWYDVKYGSGGFNTYGYRAGCNFVDGNFNRAREEPAAARYLCDPADAGKRRCFHDFSGLGVCSESPLYEDYGFFSVVDDDVFSGGVSEDCQGLETNMNARCLDLPAGSDTEGLHCFTDLSCVDGQVYIFGGSCAADGPGGCPPDDIMCDDPGLLTCTGPLLNDCNRRGDCRQGRCFCHLGWGGADCTIPVCLAGVGCPDGSDCPPSGFCGVPECGAFSVGDEGIGTPCATN